VDQRSADVKSESGTLGVPSLAARLEKGLEQLALDL
jgi:hypothetical protein